MILAVVVAAVEDILLDMVLLILTIVVDDCR
jgi:hypothetical protein